MKTQKHNNNHIYMYKYIYLYLCYIRLDSTAVLLIYNSFDINILQKKVTSVIIIISRKDRFINK